MRTVESIISAVYETDTNAAAKLGLKSRSAVSNWKKWGYFPTRLLPVILADAKKASVKLDISQVPTQGRQVAAAR
jgi:hypothetical protein